MGLGDTQDFAAAGLATTNQLPVGNDLLERGPTDQQPARRTD